MSGPYSAHLSADDIDAWLARALAPAALEHLERCAECRERVRAEAVLVTRLQQLTRLAPSPGFADRVMAQVRVPDPFALRRLRAARGRLFASRRSLAVAATLALVLLGSMAGSIVWSLANPDVLPAIGRSLAAEAGQWFWLGLRGLVSNLIEQPWYGGLRDLVGTPGRLALAGGVLSAAYLMGVLLLRRLLALPTQRVADAHL